MAGAIHADAGRQEAIFAANRAKASVMLAVRGAAPGSRLARLHEAGALRVRFPNVDEDGALEAVIVNTAGGMTGGDSFALDIEVGADAGLTVTSAAAEKIYRSLGENTAISVRAVVGPRGSLTWLPQETIVFDQARLQRSIEIDLERDSRLIIAEAAIFGRAAMGETVAFGHYHDRRRLRVGGRLVFAETTRLDGSIAERLAERAIAAGGVAIASVIKIPGGDDDIARSRALEQSFAGEVGVSAWNGVAVARLVAADGAALRRDLALVLTALGATLPRLWTN
jgi:urease accessory protein